MSVPNNDNERRYLLDDPRVINGIFYGLIAVCVVLAALDFVPVPWEAHPHFEYESWPFFYCLYGFVAYSLIVNSAKGLRMIVKRDEDYYD